MGIFYSSGNGESAFFDEDVHGPRQIEKPQTAREIKAGKRPVMIDNPDCLIPADAIEITRERHQQLLMAQVEGKRIVTRGGQPVAVDQAFDGERAAASRRARRDRLLSGSDWTQLDDTFTGDPALKLAWAEYRQALRDLDMTASDWPVAPDARASDGAA